MLNILGIGLRGLRSITLEEADVIRSSDVVYLDSYTSIYPKDAIDEISSFFNIPIIPVRREFVEGESPLLKECETRKVALLVIGDGMSATTHKVIELGCLSKGIQVHVYENASILNVVPGKLGLYTYKMGPPVSLPFLENNFFPVSVFNKISRNHSNGMHTIVLLDLKDGRTVETKLALKWLLELEEKSGKEKFLSDATICIVSAVSHNNEKIKCGSINLLRADDFAPPCSIVILSGPDEFEKENIAPFVDQEP